MREVTKIHIDYNTSVTWEVTIGITGDFDDDEEEEKNFDKL